MNKMVLRNISYGLYTIGAVKDGRNVGCVVNSVFQITSDPATVCVSMNKNNFTHDCIKEAGKFSVSIISEETNPMVTSKFGFASSKDTDKYEGFKYEVIDGVPVVMENNSGYMVCEVISFTDAGTHSMILAKIVDGDVVEKNRPMTYEYYHRVVKGKAPKNAPTYIEEEDNTAADKSSEAVKADKYVCDVCGYIYEGDITKEPDDYVCPICKVDKSHFKPLVEEAPKVERYVCDICGYIYEGDITKEPDDYVCPICKADKSHFKPLVD